MWTKELFGTDVYHLVGAFIAYSILGWLVESIYMSFCNKKLTNRGFGKGPFCPIYGFGAIIGYILLTPLSGKLYQVYILGALLATIFEYLVGCIMIKSLGKLWWDYSDKPFNYRGIICLESTIAWGFYAVIIVTFLHGKVIKFIGRMNYNIGIKIICLVMLLVIIDYSFQLMHSLNIDMKRQREKLKEKYKSFKARWY